MNIKDLIIKYSKQGNNIQNSRNLASQEIIINKISSSKQTEFVTLKGGIVMYNITKQQRPVTKDIDLDFIRHSIDKESIKLFIRKLNQVKDPFTVSIDGEIEKLHHENYKGVRVNLMIKDRNKNKLRFKLDIGVHTYTAIEQNQLMYSFDINDTGFNMAVNPPEQIVAEKLITLSRVDNRYKDLYDVFFLIKNNYVDRNITKHIIELMIKCSDKGPNDINDMIQAIEDTLSNKNYQEEALNPAYKWIDAEFSDIKETIMGFIDSL